MNDTLRTILQIVLVNDTGDSCYRMRWPGRQLAEQAPGWRIINLDANAAERFAWGEQADLLVLYQSHDLDLLPLMERRRALGKKTLVEYNDNFYAPPASSPVSKEWSSPLLWQIYETFMDQSDEVIVTGPGLEALLADKTSAPLHILENHMPAKPPPFDTLWPSTGDGLNIGWAGSLGHMADLLAAAPLLREVLALDPKITLYLMGNSAIPQMLELPPERLRFVEWGSMEQYLKFWEPVHIGLAPLIDTPYNRCRSDIKAVEMASRGVLPLLSEALPYRLFFNETGIQGVTRFSEFIEKVRYYLAEPARLKADARRCYDYVSQKRIGPLRTERLDLYGRMLSSQSTDFNWPVHPGYHELMGTPQSGTEHSRALAAINQCFKAKDFAGALAAASQASARNPWGADLRLAQMRCLARTNPAALGAKFEDALKTFPNDLRFRLLQLALLKQARDLDLVWQKVLEKLQGHPPAYCAAFEAEVVSAFCRQLQAAPTLAAIGEALLEIYPANSELQYAMAFYHARFGQPQRAHALFAALSAARKELEINQRFLSSLDSNFIETWTAALKARQALGT